MRIAMLGLGRMGRGMAARLLSGGHELTVWNRSPGKGDELVARGAVRASRAEEAAGGAEVVMTSLTADDAVIDVLLPLGQPLRLDAGAVVVECSTVLPATVRSLAVAYRERLVACPILGSPSAVESGQAGLAVGGPAELVDELEPLWSSLSSTVWRCGDDPGQAEIVKLVNNYLLMGGVAVLAEAVAAGQRAGLADEFLIDLLSELPMVATGLRNRVEDLVAGDHEGWFPTPFGAKDVHLLVEVASGHSTALPIAELVEKRYADAAASGLAERDITAVIELIRHPR
jgi:3-hydroxyisobutyrate dehydrogenase-like beta-hydroxyacid dehydrogenase